MKQWKNWQPKKLKSNRKYREKLEKFATLKKTRREGIREGTGKIEVLETKRP